MAVFKFRNLNSGQATPIPPGEFTVGREDEAYVHVEDASISRKHAVVTNDENGFTIQDVGSANGTALNGGLLVGKTLLSLGDVVYIGSVPFRLDPEVAGEPAAAPSAGMRSVNRAYMRRDTEKIPAMGEPGRVMETISVEKLSAPAVSQSMDIDAGDLNAITMTEPEAPMAQSLSTVQPGSLGLKEVAAPKRVLSVPTPQSHAQSRPQMEKVTRPPQQQTQRLGPTPTVVQPTVEAPATPASGYGWGWALALFLAGMGAGLLLGLYFAKLFFEMGGKAAGLP